MSKGPKHSGQNAKPSKHCGWRKKGSNETEELLNRLRNTKSEREWREICDEIKANGGYPDDWYAKVVLSGLMHKTSQSWR